MKSSTSVSSTVLTVIALVIAVMACTSDNTGPNTDTLTLGTGLGTGRVTGVTQDFSLDSDGMGVIVNWALETVDDISGYPLAILVEKHAGTAWIEQQFFEYGVTEGRLVFFHIDSFYHRFGTGSFRATAFVGTHPVVSAEYTVNHGN